MHITRKFIFAKMLTFPLLSMYVKTFNLAAILQTCAFHEICEINSNLQYSLILLIIDVDDNFSTFALWQQ